MNSFRLPVSGFLAFGLALGAMVCARGSAPGRIEIPDAAQPQLTLDTKGRVWLVYGRKAPPVQGQKDGGHGATGGHGHGSATPKPAGDIFVARSDDGGTTFAPAQKVACVPGLMLGMRRGPRIAVSGDRVTVTVIGQELFAFTSTDSGKSWSNPVTINEVPTCAREGLHDLAAGPDGRLFVTWLDLRNGTMELWGADSMDGGRTWRKNAQVYRSPDKSICECCHPTALFDAQGNLAVMWRNSVAGARDLWMTTRANGAQLFSPARKIGEGTWTLNACPMDGGRLVALGGGKFGSVWQRAGDVFFAPASGPEINLGKGKQPVALRHGGATLVVYQHGTDLVSARVGGSGAAAEKRAAHARFPVLVAAPASRGALLAYEQGPPKGVTSVIVERL